VRPDQPDGQHVQWAADQECRPGKTRLHLAHPGKELFGGGHSTTTSYRKELRNSVKQKLRIRKIKSARNSLLDSKSYTNFVAKTYYYATVLFECKKKDVEELMTFFKNALHMVISLSLAIMERHRWCWRARGKGQERTELLFF
jgi:hypothetical protein